MDGSEQCASWVRTDHPRESIDGLEDACGMWRTPAHKSLMPWSWIGIALRSTLVRRMRVLCHASRVELRVAERTARHSCSI